MSDPGPTPQEDRPLEVSDQVDRLCDQFEAALRNGQVVNIEEFLEFLPESSREELLRELVAVEIDFRRGRGETISFLSYYRRFPKAAEMLDELQREWNLRDASGFIAVRDNVKMDAPSETVVYPDPNIPTQKIRQFELLSILGHGGFGTVWRARDTVLQREVAVKVPRKDRVQGMNMSLFLREARAAAKLRHPNIVAIHEVGEEDSSAFIVSDLVDGVSLKAWLQTAQPTTTESAMLVAKLATAAHHAHERGIIHRDLKPANVLMDGRGEPHIADFGLAKRDTVEDSLAINDQLVGTPAYMAPEQARGDHKAIDCRTDVYALGAILYEMLTGQRVFSGGMDLMLHQIQHISPPAPRKIRPEIPRELEAICLKCLEKDPAKRYQTAQVLADDLYRHIAGETLLGIPAALPVRMQKWLRRNRRVVLSVVPIVIAIAFSTAFVVRRIYPPTIPVDLRDVRFQTDPAGCEITVVALDPTTGEPDPRRIGDAKGVTPLTMRLAPGDYLVVAVLDRWRFNEAFRRVPSREETIPIKVRNLYWKLLPSGELETDVIKIPRPDVTVGMGFVEATNRLSPPKPLNSESSEQWQLPSFYVDRRVVEINDLKMWGVSDSKIEAAGSGPAAIQNFYRFVENLEDQGKRLPSAAELYYLSMVVCSAAGDNVSTNSRPKCLLPDGSEIEGLHDGVWEWTSTRPGGPLSGSKPIPKVDSNVSLVRMIGGGELPATAANPAGFKSATEPTSNVAGARGVRSVSPRRRPEDFARPAVGHRN